MTEFVIFITGLFSGIVIYWFITDSRNKNQKNGYDEKLQTERELRIKAEAELQLLKTSHTESIKNMRESFDSLAYKAIQNNSEIFLKMAQPVMEKYINKAEFDFEKRKESIDNLVKPLKESLQKQENLVKELEQNRNQIFGSLKNYLEELGKQQKSLEKETGALVAALKAPKVRGRWGEIGLRRIVEFSGMSSFCDFFEQVQINTDDGKLRPDMVVNLPGNKKIIIDSKVPLNSYLEALETDSDESRKQKLNLHAKAFLQHIKNLSTKQYWSQFDETVDFVVMYIEVEPAFGAALTENQNLVQLAMENKIVMATPTTLIALLQTVAYSWKQHQATENAVLLWQTTKEVYDRIAIFADYLQKVGVSITNLTKNYNQAIGSWEARVLPGFRKLEQMGVSSEKKNIEPLPEVEIVPRNLQA